MTTPDPQSPPSPQRCPGCDRDVRVKSTPTGPAYYRHYLDPDWPDDRCMNSGEQLADPFVLVGNTYVRRSKLPEDAPAPEPQGPPSSADVDEILRDEAVQWAAAVAYGAWPSAVDTSRHIPALVAELDRLRDELNEETRLGNRFQQEALSARDDADRAWDARNDGGAW